MAAPQIKEQEELLALAKNLYGEERIRAYQLAGRDDLAREHANELLIGEGFHYGRGPQAFDPFKHDNWEVFGTKRKFDENSISYDKEAVRRGVKNTYCSTLCPPYQEKIEAIDTILREYELAEKERIDFFTKMRERTKRDSWLDETGDFVFGLKETEYSALAAHTGIPRGEVVSHYLNNIFGLNRQERDWGERSPIDNALGHLLYIDDLETKLQRFMEKENITAQEIVTRAMRMVNELKPNEYTTHRPYMIVNSLSRIIGIEFPKDIVIKVLEDYLADERNVLNEISEGRPVMICFTDIQDDPRITYLRRKSILKEIELGYRCVIKRVEYAVRYLGLSPAKGKLKSALNRWVERYRSETYPSGLEELIGVGRRYELLSEDEISSFERKLEIVKKIKNK
ncbi:hypothetical protein HYU22_01850 [Candidatus Woesearchaeota archaeon]|nr:hypothetical protein [Candidatus Woesearchaeota archaeon]